MNELNKKGVYMGTNYYLKNKPCKECGHSETKKHVGKSSLGWEFQFRGYREQSIVSIEDWENEFQDENKILIDENGEVKDKKKLFEDARSSKEVHALLNLYNVTCGQPQTEREKKYCETRRNQQNFNSERSCWKDNEGFSFLDCEFS